MAFQEALTFVLGQEGGYNPDDPSYKGVMQTTYDAYRSQRGLPRRDVRDISSSELTAIYQVQYWLASGAQSLPDDLALIHFDTAVNMGVGAAGRILAQSGGDPVTYLKLRAQRYQAIASANPSKAHNLSAWMNRVRAVADSAGVNLSSEDATEPDTPTQAGFGGPLAIILLLGVAASFFRGTLRGSVR